MEKTPCKFLSTVTITLQLAFVLQSAQDISRVAVPTRPCG